ncbi:MAG: RNA polymerase sigma factor [Gaiellaceae bacterium]|jgi:RNA polymerase sigma factor (sigma-70 family)
MLSTDSAALEYAFARFRGDIYAFVLSRLHDRADAEEVTQQTFLDAAVAFARGSAPRAMRPWLFSVAQRRVADELRRRGRRMLPVEETVAQDAPVEPSLRGALERLSPEDRRLLYLRFVAERTHLEIAAIVGCNETASKMRVSRAAQRLRRELDAGADV